MLCFHRFVLVTLAACAWAVASSPADAAEITYRLASDSRVSINIYDGHGTIVRELLHGAPRLAGENTDIWDGCDRNGTPLVPQKYTWKLLARPQPLKTEYLLTLGNTFPYFSKNADVRSPEIGLGPGSHCGPFAVAADNSGLYVASKGGENVEHLIIKLSPDGTKRLWSQINPNSWTGGKSIGLAGDRVVVLSSGDEGQVWLFDSTTGGLQTNLPTVLQGPRGTDGRVDPTLLPADLAAAGDIAALVWTEQGLLRWLDLASGKVIGEIKGLDHPAAIALSPDGEAFIANNSGTLIRVRQNSDPVLIARGLGKIARLAYAGEGKLVAYDENTKQVIRIDRGQRTVAYGRLGGRPTQTTWNAEAQGSFFGITGLCMMPDGGFLVAEAECAPRRVARFDADGRFQQEWVGGQVWGPWVVIDPLDPSSVWMSSQWGWIMRMQVDWSHRTWAVRSVHQFHPDPTGLIPNHDNTHLWSILHHGGNAYLVSDQNPWVMLRVDCANDRLVPMLYADCHAGHNRKYLDNAIVQSQLATVGGDDASLVWVDKNGDGQVQANELVAGTSGPWLALPRWTEQGVIACDANSSDLLWYSLTWDPSGLPHLRDFPNGKKVLETPARAGKVEGRWGSYPWRDPSDGGWYSAFNADMPDWGKSKDSFVQAWDPSGKPRWQAGGMALGGTAAHVGPGDIGVIRRFAGSVFGTLVYNDFREGRYPLTSYLWDKDGLWAGSLMEELDRESAPVWLYGSGAETLGTTIIEQPNGSALLLWQGINEVRAGRVTGWQNWQRSSGEIELSEPTQGLSPGLGVWNGWIDASTDSTATISIQGDADAEIVIDGVFGRGKIVAKLSVGQRSIVQVRTSSKAKPRLQGLPASAILHPRPTVTVRPFGSGSGLIMEVLDMAGRVTFRRTTNGDEIWGKQMGPDEKPTFDGLIARVAGGVEPLQTGWHTFTLADPGIGKLQVAGHDIGQFGHDQVYLEAGKRYPIEIKYSTHGRASDEQGIRLRWATPTGTWPGTLSPIPESQLYSN